MPKERFKMNATICGPSAGFARLIPLAMWALSSACAPKTPPVLISDPAVRCAALRGAGPGGEIQWRIGDTDATRTQNRVLEERRRRACGEGAAP